MKLLEIVSEEKLTAEILRDGPRETMRRWKDTAVELSRTRFRQIIDLHTAFNEATDSELRPDKVIHFLGLLLDLLDNDEERLRVIHAEAFGSLKKPGPELNPK
jgi:hypothetical protein